MKELENYSSNRGTVSPNNNNNNRTPKNNNRNLISPIKANVPKLVSPLDKKSKGANLFDFDDFDDNGGSDDDVS